MSRKWGLKIANLFFSVIRCKWLRMPNFINMLRFKNHFIGTWNVRTLQGRKKECWMLDCFDCSRANIEKHRHSCSLGMETSLIFVCYMRLIVYTHFSGLVCLGQQRKKQESGLFFGMIYWKICNLYMLASVSELSFCIWIGRSKFANIFSCYNPSMKFSEDIKEKFYSESRKVVEKVFNS